MFLSQVCTQSFMAIWQATEQKAMYVLNYAAIKSFLRRSAAVAENLRFYRRSLMIHLGQEY